jgi:hypothetical protein
VPRRRKQENLLARVAKSQPTIFLKPFPPRLAYGAFDTTDTFDSARMTPRFTGLVAACVIAATGLARPVASARDARTVEIQTASAARVRFEPPLIVSSLESELLRDACDGHWDEHTLFAAALIAGGVANEAELRGTCQLFAVIAAELKSGLDAAADSEQRAEKTLAFLHRRLLSGGYDLYATPLPRVLATGRYNCVSATILFNSLAETVGLEVGAVRLPNHTCTDLLEGKRRTRIEATCADWFSVRDRPRAITDSNNEPPIAAIPRAQSEPQETISDVALVGMVYYNRGVEALKNMDFEQAILLNRLALMLDAHNSSARGNLLAAINKQALKLAALRQFGAALALVDEGLAIDPAHGPLQQNRDYIDRLRNRGVAR